jgi:hypothetical protein
LKKIDPFVFPFDRVTQIKYPDKKGTKISATSLDKRHNVKAMTEPDRSTMLILRLYRIKNITERRRNITSVGSAKPVRAYTGVMVQKA